MNKKVVKSIIVVAIIILVVVSILFFKKNSKIDLDQTNTVEKTTTNENLANENVVNNTEVENVVQNVAEATTQTNKEEQKLVTKDFTNSVYEDSSSVGTTDKKQEAINLVKKQWGEDNSVTFSCDSITSDGIYVIAVTSKERAVVLNYFRVDLDSKTVTIDY